MAEYTVLQQKLKAAFDSKLGKNEKAVSAALADAATKATQDESGNVIASTYATKTEVSSGLKAKAEATHTHATADVTGLDTALAGKADATHEHATADVTGLDTALAGKADATHEHATYIPKTGSTGTLTVTETISSATTVNASSARSMNLADAGALTVEDGAAGESWITVVALEGTATITLGTNWAWSGSAPDLAKGLVTFAWYGTFGVANFTKFGE